MTYMEEICDICTRCGMVTDGYKKSENLLRSVS